ncbi:MAG: cytochrome c biogenesis protein CcdA [Candidatus Altiarchaeales archaeon]|nr:cytochrome c biogenesis protein CcdA [Candidatus Altiarchaeales archaeon]
MENKGFFVLLVVLVLLACMPVLVLGEGGETCSVGENVCALNESAGEAVSFGQAGELSENVTCIVYFYGIGCSKCAETTPFVQSLEEEYCNRIKVHHFEIYHNTSNYDLYNRYAEKRGIPLEKRGIPLVAIGDKYFMGVSQIESNLEDEILRENPLESVCPLTDEKGCFLDYNPTDLSPPKKMEVSIPLILVAGLVDSINPCAFAVMIFLLTFLLEVSSSSRRVLKAGLAYIASVYVTYFLSGLGFLSVVQLAGLSGTIVKVAAVVAILAGLVNIKDYFWYGKGFTLKIPESKKNTIEKWVHKANVPGAIVLGFLVSMFELPCTGGVYLAILALMADTLTRITAIAYLLVYNIMFIAPLVVILLLVMHGMSAEKIEHWRQSGKNVMKLAMGLLLVILGVLMLL